MATTPVTLRAANFLGTIGVNTHISWQDSGSAYANQANISKALAYLGVKYVRDGVPYEGWTLPFYQSLAATGIKFDLITTSTSFNKTGNFSTDLGHIASLAKAAPGSVVSIEGLNEINTWTVNYNGQNTGTNLAVGRDVQALLYNQVKADPTLADIPVLNLTLGRMSAQQGAVMGDMSSLADYATWHTYFGNGDQPGANIASGIASAKVLNSADPVQITETGYYTAVNDMAWGGGGVTEAVQAKLTLNLLMDAAKGGVVRTYLYELLENNLSPTSSIEGSFGLFRADGSPKQAATAIHNLTTILADGAADAASFDTAPLDVSVTGLGSTGKTMLLQKSAGQYGLVVWAEPDIWNEATRSAMTAPSQAVTITLGSTATAIKVYDPLTGTSAITTANNANSITLQVTDHPLIVEVIGASSVVTPPVMPPVTPPVKPPVTPTPYSTTIGSGSDTLVLKISEDAYNGDAQYTVSVDGKQLGGTLTAKAIFGSGVSDTITLKGDWGVGNHSVAVTFLNDAYGGSATTDRNLHIDAVTYNGVATPAGTTLFSNGSATYTVKDTTAIPSAAARTTIGSGSDTLVLKISQDAYNGDAQYTIKVDGVQQGGTLTAKAIFGSGVSDTVTVKGNWAAGNHNVAVTFLNDAYGGSATTDRNLHIDAVTYNGVATPAGTTLFSNGAATYTVKDTTSPGIVLGSGTDTIALKLSQDAWNGNAQYVVLVDGTQIGGIQTASSLHGSGASDLVTVQGSWGVGNHTLAVRFLNDAYGGTPGTDRNLYVDAVSYDGKAVAGGTAALMSGGDAIFTLVDTTAPSVNWML